MLSMGSAPSPSRTVRYRRPSALLRTKRPNWGSATLVVWAGTREMGAALSNALLRVLV